MIFFIILFSFLLGLIVGSFLNVLICRHNTGKGILGRSKCFSCNKIISFFELVPVFSFLFQRGKCRKCKSGISWQYPLVELVTGILFALVAWKFLSEENLLMSDFVITLFYFVIVSILVVVTVYDIHHKIIPNFYVYLFGLLSASYSAILFYLGQNTLGDLVIGPALFSVFALFWLVSSGRWMGFGDAKLVLGIGFLLGLNLSISAVLVAFWSGALVGILLLLVQRSKITMKSEIPFAPFLVFGALVALFSGISII